MQGIRNAGFKYCTPIQSNTLPIALAGRDVAGQAQTGTGKTAAFLIATFCRLLNQVPRPAKRPGQPGPRCLIIAPTRELARQIEKDTLVLGKFCDYKTVCVHGGIDYEKQRNQIKQGVDILIATPGRLIDYYKQKFFSLRKVEVLVIDEADRLFDMGFRQDIRYLLRRISPYDKRLSMLFSATLSHEVMELCYEHLNNAEKVAVEPEKVVVDEVEQSLYHVGTDEKLSLLLGVLKKEEGEKVIIFCNTKRSAEKLARTLEVNGYSAGQISGDIHQRARIRVLEKFSQGDLNILIATDVASRGLHIDNITHVINYELPQDAEDYIHRIGRTARAGAKGTAISMGCEDYVHSLERIEEVLKFKIPVVWPDDEMFLEIKKPPPLPRKARPPVRGKKTARRPEPKGSRRLPHRRPPARRGPRPKQ
ncbi:MAG: DEAD/DEAH box helicase [Nitrospinota bacterium]|nr:DEAD/DEAH box helicase [Nitrospinota bacterium]